MAPTAGGKSLTWTIIDDFPQTDSHRSISLHQRIRSSALTEASVVRRRMALLFGLDFWYPGLWFATSWHHPGNGSTYAFGGRLHLRLAGDSDGLLVHLVDCWVQHVSRAAPAVGGRHCSVPTCVRFLRIPDYALDHG